jgi:hypothetical protein
MGTRTEEDEELALEELADPAFFARWAEVRLRHATTHKGSFGYFKAKWEYETVLTEYRRRMSM